MKKYLRIVLAVEVLIFLGLLAKDAFACHGDCFNNTNTAVIFILPLIILTLVLYIGLKLVKK